MLLYNYNYKRNKVKQSHLNHNKEDYIRVSPELASLTMKFKDHEKFEIFLQTISFNTLTVKNCRCFFQINNQRTEEIVRRFVLIVKWFLSQNI